jgi:hypothetical protein
MNLHRRLALVLVMLALAGCVQGRTSQREPSSAPYSHQSGADMHDRGGGGDGGGGSGM